MAKVEDGGVEEELMAHAREKGTGHGEGRGSEGRGCER